MKPALVIVDMLQDTFRNHPNSFVVKSAQAFIPVLNGLIDWFHEKRLPVVFACDSFFEQDFIFQGRMHPHSIRGTSGADVMEDLHRAPSDLVLEKRRFSAFFKTDLDQTLRMWGVDTVVSCGIATHVCVLTTALDAVSHDFQAILLEDCTAAHAPRSHEPVLDAYRNTPLHPLLRVCTSTQLVELFEKDE